MANNNTDQSRSLSKAEDIIKRLLTRYSRLWEVDGRAAIFTDNDKFLLEGYEFLGWEDPHLMPEWECCVDGCYELAIANGRYGGVCEEHIYC